MKPDIIICAYHNSTLLTMKASFISPHIYTMKYKLWYIHTMPSYLHTLHIEINTQKDKTRPNCLFQAWIHSVLFRASAEGGLTLSCMQTIIRHSSQSNIIPYPCTSTQPKIICLIWTHWSHIFTLHTMKLMPKQQNGEIRLCFQVKNGSTID